MKWSVLLSSGHVLSYFPNHQMWASSGRKFWSFSSNLAQTFLLAIASDKFAGQSNQYSLTLLTRVFPQRFWICRFPARRIKRHFFLVWILVRKFEPINFTLIWFYIYKDICVLVGPSVFIVFCRFLIYIRLDITFVIQLSSYLVRLLAVKLCLIN